MTASMTKKKFNILQKLMTKKLEIKLSWKLKRRETNEKHDPRLKLTIIFLSSWTEISSNQFN